MVELVELLEYRLGEIAVESGIDDSLFDIDRRPVTVATFLGKLVAAVALRAEHDGVFRSPANSGIMLCSQLRMIACVEEVLHLMAAMLAFSVQYLEQCLVSGIAGCFSSVANAERSACDVEYPSEDIESAIYFAPDVFVFSVDHSSPPSLCLDVQGARATAVRAASPENTTPVGFICPRCHIMVMSDTMPMVMHTPSVSLARTAEKKLETAALMERMVKDERGVRA